MKFTGQRLIVYWAMLGGFTVAMFALLAFLLWCLLTNEGRAADTLPVEITHGQSLSRVQIEQQRRWSKMCKGPARYDAMREAAALGRPNPC